MTDPGPTRYIFAPCCGLQRTAPLGTNPGDIFDLVACPRCGQAFHGRLLRVPSDMDPAETTFITESLPWPTPSPSSDVSSPETTSSGPSGSSAP